MSAIFKAEVADPRIHASCALFSEPLLEHADHQLRAPPPLQPFAKEANRRAAGMAFLILECYTSPVDFSWDERKAASNLRKHGVSFGEAATVFADPLALAIDDAVAPERTLLLGMSERQRLLLVVHAELDHSTMRIISARRATSHERRRYEEEGH